MGSQVNDMLSNRSTVTHGSPFLSVRSFGLSFREELLCPSERVWVGAAGNRRFRSSLRIDRYKQLSRHLHSKNNNID